MDMRALGERLRSMREERGITRKDLAAAAWLNIGSYRRYERGARCMSVYTLDKLCKALGVTPNDLMGY